MSDTDLESALREEAARLDAEDSARQSRAERAGSAAAKSASNGLRQEPAAAPAPAPASAAEITSESVEALIDSLGPQEICALGVVAMDVLVCRLFGAKAELTAAERAKLTTAAVPVLKLYAPQLKLHPLTGLGIVAGTIYASKALPEGAGLKALLGGIAGGSAPEGSDVGAQGAPGPHKPGPEGSSPSPAIARAA